MESRRVSKNIRFCQKKKLGYNYWPRTKLVIDQSENTSIKYLQRLAISEKMIKYIWDNYYNIKFNYISI